MLKSFLQGQQVQRPQDGRVSDTDRVQAESVRAEASRRKGMKDPGDARLMRALGSHDEDFGISAKLDRKPW